MADTKLSALTALGTSWAGGDKLYIVDVSDTTDGASGTSKSLTIAALFTSPSITTSIKDVTGNEMFKFSPAASAVNEITVANAATTFWPELQASGDDTNIHIGIRAKGTGQIILANNTDPVLIRISSALSGFNASIIDTSENELLDFKGNTSAVNQLSVENASAGFTPILGVRGGDTHISNRLGVKGTGYILTQGPVHGLNPAAASYANAGDTTLSAAEVLGGIVVKDPAGAGRNLTLPTATALVAALPGAAIGDTIKLLVVNGADAAENLTIVADASGAFDTNQTAASRIVGQNASKVIYIRITAITGTPAYVVYA